VKADIDFELPLFSSLFLSLDADLGQLIPCLIYSLMQLLTDNWLVVCFSPVLV